MTDLQLVDIQYRLLTRAKKDPVQRIHFMFLCFMLKIPNQYDGCSVNFNERKYK